MAPVPIEGGQREAELREGCARRLRVAQLELHRGAQPVETAARRHRQDRVDHALHLTEPELLASDHAQLHEASRGGERHRGGRRLLLRLQTDPVRLVHRRRRQRERRAHRPEDRLHPDVTAAPGPRDVAVDVGPAPRVAQPQAGDLGQRPRGGRVREVVLVERASLQVEGVGEHRLRVGSLRVVEPQARDVDEQRQPGVRTVDDRGLGERTLRGRRVEAHGVVRDPEEHGGPAHVLGRVEMVEHLARPFDRGAGLRDGRREPEPRVRELRLRDQLPPAQPPGQ